MENKVDQKGFYSLNHAMRFTPIKSFQTIRRYVDTGKLKATRGMHGYTIRGRDLIEFVAKLEAGDFHK